MTWTVPVVTRVDEPFTGTERETLEGFLDWYRATLLHKCAGLTPQQLAKRSAPPSNLSLIGLIRHMTEVERGWFRRRFTGERVERLYGDNTDCDPPFDNATPATAEADHAAFIDELARTRAIVAGHSWRTRSSARTAGR